jgi:hypothetical protein
LDELANYQENSRDERSGGQSSGRGRTEHGRTSRADSPGKKEGDFFYFALLEAIPGRD